MLGQVQDIYGKLSGKCSEQGYDCCCWVAHLCLTLCDSMDWSTQGPLSTISRVCSNSCPLSWWCYRTISSFVAPLSSFPQSFPALGSFPVSQLFISGHQSIEASSSASVLPMNIQGLFPLGFTSSPTLIISQYLKFFPPQSPVVFFRNDGSLCFLMN